MTWRRQEHMKSAAWRRRERHRLASQALCSPSASTAQAYNLWAPTVHSLFLDIIRDEQLNASSGEYAGFVPNVVPYGASHGGFPGDLSWTAAYPLIARWLLLYHGAIHIVRDHWAALTAWTDGVAAAGAAAHADALPDFYVRRLRLALKALFLRRARPLGPVPSASERLPARSHARVGALHVQIFGDWCAVEAREQCQVGTGPQAAAANWLLALQAMVHMATALGEASQAQRYAAALAEGQRAFDARYFNASVNAHVGGRPPIEHQTLSALAINALDGATFSGASKHVSATRAALRADVVMRGHRLTTGSAGAKWLLRTLSAGVATPDGTSSAHDDALRLATQTSRDERGAAWGWWAQQGATTCYENWSGKADPSHPPPPTHNHIFRACSGLKPKTSCVCCCVAACCPLPDSPALKPRGPMIDTRPPSVRRPRRVVASRTRGHRTRGGWL